MSKKRKILLIGAGGWGAVHLNVYSHHKAWAVEAIADRNAEVLKRASQEFGIPPPRCFRDPFEAIEKVECDAISVVVRNPFRTPILLRAIETGLPICVEKPLAHSIADVRKIIRAARRSKAPMMVSQNFRFDPQVRRMAEFIQSRRGWGRLESAWVEFARNVRELGDHYVRRIPDGLGLGAEMCIHHYDLMRFLLGANPVRIRASARRAPGSAMKGWATIEAWIEFPGGTAVNYHATYDVATSRTPWGGRWTLDFERGSLTFHPYAENKIPIEYHTLWRGRWRLERRVKDLERQYRTFLVGPAFEEFTQALNEGRSPECGLRDNVQSLAIMFAVIHAAQTGKPVEFIPFLKKITRGR